MIAYPVKTLTLAQAQARGIMGGARLKVVYVLLNAPGVTLMQGKPDPVVILPDESRAVMGGEPLYVYESGKSEMKGGAVAPVVVVG